MTENQAGNKRGARAQLARLVNECFARFPKAVVRQARCRWYGLVLVCFLAAVIPGCELIVMPLFMASIPVFVIQSVTEEPGPPRKLHAIKARVTDAMENPLPAALTVRVADRYMAAPERLAALASQTGPDGAFTILIGQAKAVCVDVKAEGMQAKRKWFIVLYHGVGTTLPEDQSEIVFINASYEMDGLTTIRLDPAEL
jgi:hypothetical protein